jgi:recombination DNA repair RAD52 pathway protein
MFQENLELTKEVQVLKVNLENSTYLKSQLAGQLEDARRRLEDDERVKKNPITDKIKKLDDTYFKIL